MITKKGELVLYGIEKINENLDAIVNSLQLKKKIFEVKLIISEAITNAFIHGNNSDKTKPINIKWELANNILCIQIKDCGQYKNNLNINKNFANNDLLSENGRGLFIISEYADEVIFENNTLTIKKII